MYQVRLKFSKHGPIRFIGHLDVMRYFQKVMRRAEIDIAYSEGYHPHQLMSFALPLSVGATSDAEYLDLTLRTMEDTDTLIRRLNAVCREGIVIEDARVLPAGARKAMTAVYACRWRIRPDTEVLTEEILPPDTVHMLRDAAQTGAAFDSFLSGQTIHVRKKTKKGDTLVDIRPLIFEASFDPPTASFEMLLKSGSTDHVKPSLVFDAFLHPKEALPPAALKLHRLEIYAEDRVPLIDAI